MATTLEQQTERIFNRFNHAYNAREKDVETIRLLVVELAKLHRENPEKLKYLPCVLEEGLASSAYYHLMKDINEDRAIDAMLAVQYGGLGATITSKKERLVFKDNQLHHAVIEEEALPKSKFTNVSGAGAHFKKNAGRKGVFSDQSVSFAKFNEYSSSESTFEDGAGSNITIAPYSLVGALVTTESDLFIASRISPHSLIGAEIIFSDFYQYAVREVTERIGAIKRIATGAIMTPEYISAMNRRINEEEIETFLYVSNIKSGVESLERDRIILPKNTPTIDTLLKDVLPLKTLFSDSDLQKLDRKTQEYISRLFDKIAVLQDMYAERGTIKDPELIKFEQDIITNVRENRKSYPLISKKLGYRNPISIALRITDIMYNI